MKKVIVLVLAFALVFPVLGFTRNGGHGGGGRGGGHATTGHGGGGGFHGGFYRGGVRGYSGYHSGEHGNFPNHWHGGFYQNHGAWVRRGGLWVLPFIGGVMIGGIFYPNAYWICDYPVYDPYGNIATCDGGHWQY